MKFTNKIPVLTKWSFRDKYFIPAGSSADQGRTRAPLFEIHRRDDVAYRCQSVVPANRLDFYMMVLVTGGEGIKTFGSKEYYIRKGTLCFVAPGMITNWQEIGEEQKGYLIIFDEHFLPHLNTFPFFRPEGCPVMALTAAQEQYFEHYFQEIEKEQDIELLRAFTTIILRKTQQLYAGREHPAGSNAAIRLTAAFTALLDKDIEELTIKQIAAALNVTQNHLNDTVKAVTGKTAGTHIRERIIREVAQLLIHTHLSIAEICYRFNFADQSYFIRFFKKYTGLTPGQFRDAHQENHPGA